MKKFIFKFEAVLSHRKRELEIAQIKVSKVKSEIISTNNYLEDLKDKVSKVKQGLTTNLQEGHLIGLENAIDHNSYMNNLLDKINKTKNDIDLLEKKLAETLKIVVEKQRAKAILEKLKENEYVFYLNDIEREESRIIDDMTSARIKMNSIDNIMFGS